MSGKDVYDLSPQQREILDWKANRRLQLREAYLKECYLPGRQYPVMDTALLRLNSTYETYDHYFKPTIKNYMKQVIPIVGLITFLAWSIKRRRGKREHLYRTGQVSYRDRPFKHN